MPTPKKIWFPGCTYHITARGNHKDDIFKDKSDFDMYLILMKECLKYYEEYNYEIISYCLMNNHVHLLIRANNKETAYLIRRLHSMYTKYFNNKYGFVGHLYQDKYSSKLIKDDMQMLEASRYIHLNPVKAKMVDFPQEYAYSSYNMYIGLEEEKLINSSRILGYFVEERNRELYQRFVEGTSEVVP